MNTDLQCEHGNVQKINLDCENLISTNSQRSIPHLTHHWVLQALQILLERPFDILKDIKRKIFCNYIHIVV